MLPDRLRTLVHLLARLPGVGEKTAQRFALYLALESDQLSLDLGSALCDLSQQLGSCTLCGNIAEVNSDGECVCDICQDDRRDGKLLCIVARVQDLIAIERSGAMRGRYLVLGRLLSPLDGIGPDDLPLERLYQRIQEDAVSEIIIATPPSVDGEATALFLARELVSRNVTVTRIASGVPHGGDLEFADQITLGRAIAGRRGIDSES